MAVKEAKNLELLPRLSANEKRVFSTLSTYGACTVLDIADRSSLTKGRIPPVIEKMIQRGLVVQLKTDDADVDPHYAAIFPINRFMTIVDKLINSLEARKSELQATTQVVKEFTEYAIKNVREASNEERQKRTDRSEEDIKDLEMAMDASFSGILASVEMDLKDLSKIAQTSNEFLVESSIRTDETCFAIHKKLEPLSKNYSQSMVRVQQNVRDKLEATVDARVSNVLEFETNANKAFNEVLEAFKDSQDAFEDIIFTVLDSGIDDLEKVTRPINNQIEEAINSLKLAIQNASNNFQTEILRVLTGHKRPMISAIEGLRPKTSKILTESYEAQNEVFSYQFSDVADALENHTTIFGNAVEHLAKEFNNKVTNFVEQSLGDTSAANEEIDSLVNQVRHTTETSFEEKTSLIHITSNKTRDVLSEMMEQFILILNRSVAQNQMKLGDLVTNLETEFLISVENNGASIQNLVNFINMSLTEPVKTLMRNLTTLNDKIRKDEAEFLEKFEETVTNDLMLISKDFNGETKKSENELDKEVKRLVRRFDREIDNNHDSLINRLNVSQKNLQTIFKNFANQHEKELRKTSKEVTNVTRKLERWRGESVNLLSHEVNEKVNRSMNVLSSEIDQIISKIQNTEDYDKNEVIKVVKESSNDISKSFKGFGDSVSDLIRETLDDIASTLKKDNLSINNRLVQFRKDQDKLIDQTRIPSIKLIKEISSDYNDLYKKLVRTIERFFDSEFDSFRRSRRQLCRSIENTLNRRSNRTSKDIASLQEVFVKDRERFVKKTEESFENIERTIARDTASLLDQENSSRTTITNLTEKVIADLSNGVNKTAEILRRSLGEGSEAIFGQTAAEINKQEIELNTINDTLNEEVVKGITELGGLIKSQTESLRTKTEALQERQIGQVQEFRDSFTQTLTNDLTTKKEDLQNANDEVKTLSEKLNSEIIEVIDLEVNRAIQELEAKTSGIEGDIYGTVGRITAEAARKTEEVVVIGEQAVLGIGDRYTENLERIRQNLTDEVITRIESEAKRISDYKGSIRNIGKEHLNFYGEAISNLSEALKNDLNDTEKIAQKIFSACENLSCRFLEDLNAEISAMGNRVGLSTDRLTKEMLADFDRVFQKVKREVALFARKQFELSNKSNYQIAEAFLKSVDDLEEVMLKQIESFAKRTNMSIDRTKEISDVIRDHIRDITKSFDDAND